MGYYVRLLTPSQKVISFSEITAEVDSIKLVSGIDQLWEKIEIYESKDNLISILERNSVSSGGLAETTLVELEESIKNCYPVSAREWLKKYFSRVKTIYTFQLFATNITKNGWPILGRIQNLLKDSLDGIIQADNEGFYNENGDYILWQMYKGASGTIPVATLDEKGEWVTYKLGLNSDKAIDLFKQGIVPKRGFLGKLFKI